MAKLTFVVGYASTVKDLTGRVSCFSNLNHKLQKNHPSAELMENNLHIIGHAEMVRLVYLAQVTRIETYYGFSLTAQDDNARNDSVVAKRKELSLVAHVQCHG